MTTLTGLQGKTAVISGGTSGINLGIAKTLAASGVQVCVFGRNLEKAEAAAAEITAAGSTEALGLSADVRDPDAVKMVMAQAHERFGDLDIIIAGAAGNFPAPAIDISPNGFKAVVDIDLLGCFNTFRMGYEFKREAGCSMIAITAPQAVVATPFQAHVSAAKAGINMLVKCLALEWGQGGVRVNAISPGPIAGTEGMKRLAPTEEAEQRVMKSTAMRRFGEPEEIGNLTAFLCSDQASYINGAIMNCDGGTELGDASHDTLTSWRNPAQ